MSMTKEDAIAILICRYRVSNSHVDIAKTCKWTDLLFQLVVFFSYNDCIIDTFEINENSYKNVSSYICHVISILREIFLLLIIILIPTIATILITVYNHVKTFYL